MKLRFDLPDSPWTRCVPPVILLAISIAAGSTAPPATPETQAYKPGAPALPPEAEKIGDDLYRVGAVKLDMKARTLTCPGYVNMQKGMIEYMAVTPTGKRHESVLVLD